MRINAVCPRFTESALLNQLLSVSSDMGYRLKHFIFMGCFGKAEEITGAICWSAPGNSRFITVQTLTLDGGNSLI